MRVNFNDPESLAAWYRAAPKHIGQQLKGLYRLWPQFRPAIDQARGIVTKGKQ